MRSYILVALVAVSGVGIFVLQKCLVEQVLQTHKQYIHQFDEVMAPMTALSVMLNIVVIGTLVYTIFYVYMERRILRMKKAFINNVTHEVKTVVVTITLAADVFISKIAPMEDVKLIHDTGEKYMKIIKDSSKKMANQIDSILMLAQLNRTKPSLNRDVVDVPLIVSQEVEHCSATLKSREKAIDVALELPETEVPKCILDETHFRSVIHNLIDNAHKYSKEDKAQIVIKVWKDVKFLYVAVSDTGIGISKRDMPRIFDDFYRATKNDAYEVKGYGLGLAYVKRVMNLQGAKVFVKSEKDKGSTFTLKVRSITTTQQSIS